MYSSQSQEELASVFEDKTVVISGESGIAIFLVHLLSKHKFSPVA